MSLVLVDQPRPHVALVTLNNPARLNPMSFALVEALYVALERVGRDNACWAVVLTGAGRGFCAGLDLEDKVPPPGSEGMGLARLGMRAIQPGKAIGVGTLPAPTQGFCRVTGASKATVRVALNCLAAVPGQ